MREATVFRRRKQSPMQQLRPQTAHEAEFVHILSIGRCAKNPCTSKERGEFIAHNVALYCRGKKRVTFAGKKYISFPRDRTGNVCVCV